MEEQAHESIHIPAKENKERLYWLLHLGSPRCSWLWEWLALEVRVFVSSGQHSQVACPHALPWCAFSWAHHSELTLQEEELLVSCTRKTLGVVESSPWFGLRVCGLEVSMFSPSSHNGEDHSCSWTLTESQNYTIRAWERWLPRQRTMCCHCKKGRQHPRLAELNRHSLQRKSADLFGFDPKGFHALPPSTLKVLTAFLRAGRCYSPSESVRSCDRSEHRALFGMCYRGGTQCTLGYMTDNS